ncbi:MAG: lysylphosphatidylglycerol synthase domain-containing protein [Pseudolabrys sp.]
MLSRRTASTAMSVALLISVVISVLAVSAPAALAEALSQLVLSSVVVVVLCLTAGMLLSALRLKFISVDLGYRLSMRDAAVTLSIGQLAGNLFFQFAGQMIGRATMLARLGITPSASVIISGYERIFALVISVMLATGGSIYLFGRLSFDLQAGGMALIKLLLGLLAVTIAGAAIAWGSRARDALQQLTPAMCLRMLRSGAISLAIQLTTLAAYVIAGRALAPNIDFLSLAAASSVIMLAASLPISFGGWGMREMSAVFTLQAVGLPSASALLLGLLIGVLSIAVVAATAGLLLLPGTRRTRPAAVTATPAFDYTLVLDWAVPIAAATAVFFQIYVPVGHGDLNVNLADPLVLIGAALFALRHLGKGWPSWRVPKLNGYFAAASIVIGLAFLHGLLTFGWSDWAFTNRLLGWGMLLCYLATGALIALRAREDGLQVLLATFAATGAAIAAFDLGIAALIQLGATSLSGLIGERVSGFSQNPNAFAFMLILALCATLVLQDRLRGRVLLISVILAGLWYCASRAGLITAPLVIALAFLCGIRPRPVFTGFAGALALLLAIAVLPVLQLPALHFTPGAFIGSDALDLAAQGAQGAQGSATGTTGLHAGIAAPRVVAQAAAATQSLFQMPSFGPMPSIQMPSLQLPPLQMPSFAGPSSTTEHLLTVRQGLAMFAAHPLFGAGLGAYMAEQLRATGVPLLIHSTPVWLLAETGLVGFVVFALLAWRIFSVEFARRRQTAALMIVLTLGGFAVMAQVHDLFTQRALWLLLGTALAGPARNKASKKPLESH